MDINDKLVITGLGRVGTVLDTYDTPTGQCAHVQHLDGTIVGWHVRALEVVDEPWFQP